MGELGDFQEPLREELEERLATREPDVVHPLGPVESKTRSLENTHGHGFKATTSLFQPQTKGVELLFAHLTATHDDDGGPALRDLVYPNGLQPCGFGGI